MGRPRATTLTIDAILLLAGVACCYAFAFAGPLAARLGHESPDSALSLGLAALAAGATCFAIASVRLVLRLRTRTIGVWRARHHEGGSIIVEFAIAFPLLLWLLSMIFQMALFANASLVVKYAAFAAARAAAVSTERQFGRR